MFKIDKFLPNVLFETPNKNNNGPLCLKLFLATSRFVRYMLYYVILCSYKVIFVYY